MSERDRPLPRVIDQTLGRLASPLYLAELHRRNTKFDKGVGVERLPIPVISVGNISVGGTGKTPIVAMLTRLLLEHGKRPCIAMRGYKASKTGSSDEADEYRRAMPDVPIVARPDRVIGIRELLDSSGDPPDCVVLDDGFQHRRLARDLDIVLLDATRSPFGDRTLPRGWLREPATCLRRADAVVITRSDLIGDKPLAELCRRVSEIRGTAPLAGIEMQWSDLRVCGIDHDGELRDLTYSLEQFEGQRILAACAIGNPTQFIESCRRRLLPSYLGTFVKPDHDPFRDPTIDDLMDAAEAMNAHAIVTTEKDWSKLVRIPHDRWPAIVARPQLTPRAIWGGEELEHIVLDAAHAR